MHMLFEKYHVVLLREKSGKSRTLRLRPWFFVLIFLGMVGLLASNIWMYQRYQRAAYSSERLTVVERAYEEQNVQFANLATKLLVLQDDLERVRQFDSKLRVMMDMEQDPPETGSAVGSPVEQTLVRGYLPLQRQDLMVRKINLFLKQLATDMRLEELSQQELVFTARANKNFLMTLPSIWPVEGFLTSRFGTRANPFGAGTRDFHKGLDIAAKRGTPIVAPGGGRVIFVGRDGAYGKVVVLQHGNGVTTRYAHLDRYAVQKGDEVKRNDVIAFVGNTGRSTGPHLHYEVLVGGVNVNPLNYIIN